MKITKSRSVQDTAPWVLLFFFCHSCRSIKNQKAWTHIQNRSLIIPGALLKDLPWSNYYRRQDLLEMRVPTGHNLLTCCISAAWDLRGISPPRSRLSKTRSALYHWVSAWEILQQGTAKWGGPTTGSVVCVLWPSTHVAAGSTQGKEQHIF